MSADDGCHLSGGRIEIEVVNIVDEVDEPARYFYGFGWGQQSGGAAAIDVAADGRHRGDLAKGFKDVVLADVAGVEDVVGASEGCECLRSEETMGIRDDANAH